MVSCNAYFAQLGVFSVGSNQLRQTAEMFEIPPGDPVEFKKMLPFSSYGQGPVVTTPFKLARVAATIADDGNMPQGRWVLDPSNTRNDPPRAIVASDSARFIADAMRGVVTGGTGRTAMKGLDVPVAGKTGTAQVGEGEPHSWFAGFAPYQAQKKIAFAVIVEHGGYGAKSAAPIAREIVEAARDLGMIAASADNVATSHTPGEK
jgi:peptidoglycan glycosyltransferase